MWILALMTTSSLKRYSFSCLSHTAVVQEITKKFLKHLVNDQSSTGSIPSLMDRSIYRGNIDNMPRDLKRKGRGVISTYSSFVLSWLLVVLSIPHAGAIVTTPPPTPSPTPLLLHHFHSSLHGVIGVGGWDSPERR